MFVNVIDNFINRELIKIIEIQKQIYLLSNWKKKMRIYKF